MLVTTPTQCNPADFPPGLLAVPATEWMWTKSVGSLIGLIGWLPPGSRVVINHRASAAANRNMLVEQFLAEPSLKWILFVDSDMTPEPQTALRLLSHDVDIVGALYYSRDGSYTPMYAELQGEQVETSAAGLRKVDWVGTGCMLIRRKVLEAMQTPYMEFLGPERGEDVYFCRKAMRMGFSVYLDTAYCVGHMTAQPIDAEAAMLYSQLPRVQELRWNTLQSQRRNDEGERKRPEFELARRRLEEVSRIFDENGIRVSPPIR
jgi:hypothetical protein